MGEPRTITTLIGFEVPFEIFVQAQPELVGCQRWKVLSGLLGWYVGLLAHDSCSTFNTFVDVIGFPLSYDMRLTNIQEQIITLVLDSTPRCYIGP